MLGCASLSAFPRITLEKIDLTRGYSVRLFLTREKITEVGDKYDPAAAVCTYGQRNVGSLCIECVGGSLSFVSDRSKKSRDTIGFGSLNSMTPAGIIGYTTSIRRIASCLDQRLYAQSVLFVSISSLIDTHITFVFSLSRNSADSSQVA